MSGKKKTFSHKPATQVARRSKTPRKRLSESEGDGSCVVCALPIEIFALGHCNHFICFKCSTKLRLLCEENFCPVCRKDLKKVIFSKKKAMFDELNNLKLVKDKDYDSGIYFADIALIKDFQKVLEHKCPVCADRPPDKTFEATKLHLRKEHTLFYCEICLEHNRTFTSECKVYNRVDLARHKRHGDPDDTSHRGHPLCQYCDVRYLDDDKLFHHLRTAHYYCHLCDGGDRHEFYGTYPDLRCHYKKQHYLCEIGGCAKEEFTSVFGTELDFKAHCASVHKENKTKQQQKMERQIDLGFQYSRRDPREHGSAEFRSRSQRNRRHENPNYGNAFERDSDLEKVLLLSKEDAEKRKRAAETSSQDKPPEKPTLKNVEKDVEKPALHRASDFPKLDATLLENPPNVSNNDKASPSEAANDPPSESAELMWNKTISPKVQSEEDFPSLSAKSSGATGNHPFWGNAKSKKPIRNQGQKQSNSSTNSRPSTSQMKGKQTSKQGKKVYRHDDESFPQLNAFNSVMVGQGSAKHVEAYESHSSGQSSNIKVVPSKETRNDKVMQKQSEPNSKNVSQSSKQIQKENISDFRPKSQRSKRQEHENFSNAFERNTNLENTSSTKKDKKGNHSLKNGLEIKKKNVGNGLSEETPVLYRASDFPKLNTTSSENFPSFSSCNEVSSQTTHQSIAVIQKSNLSSAEDFPSLSKNVNGPKTNPFLGSTKAKKTKRNSSQKEGNAVGKSQPTDSHVKGKQNAKPVKKTHKRDFDNEEDFPQLDPLNAVVVGRGASKHLEAYESYSSGPSSNVKLVSSAETKREVGMQNERKPNFKNLSQDFPSLQSHPDISVPPGFSAKPLPKQSCTNNAAPIHSGEPENYQTDYNSSLSGDCVKPLRVPPGFSALPTPITSNQQQEVDACITNDFALLTKMEGAAPYFPYSLDSVNQTVTSLPNHSNATTEKTFLKSNCDTSSKLEEQLASSNLLGDFPELKSKPMPPAFFPSAPRPKKINKKKGKPVSNGTSLNLANVFDF